ncbi:hypothetical protein C8F01DRAFT_1179407 [Mycena amicta]|nr:hypothetical protein C8F01DRAFT_1179407 [Mycena amicta]
MLEKQQWRDGEDRIRAYEHMREAKQKWIEAATTTKESIEAAKRVKCRFSRVSSSHWDFGFRTLSRGKQSWRSWRRSPRPLYLTEVAAASEGLLSTVVAGVAEQIEEAIRVAKVTKSILQEIRAARLRGVGEFISVIKKKVGMGGVHRAVMQEAIDNVFAGNRAGNGSSSGQDRTDVGADHHPHQARQQTQRHALRPDGSRESGAAGR